MSRIILKNEVVLSCFMSEMLYNKTVYKTQKEDFHGTHLYQ